MKLCEANVYLIDENGIEVLILDSVDKVIPNKDEIILENIYNERKTIRARIKEMGLVEHRIVLEKLDY
ncbi:MAG TPA: CooT family nickel-binding protein [Ruminiclostridium sp.]